MAVHFFFFVIFSLLSIVLSVSLLFGVLLLLLRRPFFFLGRLFLGAGGSPLLSYALSFSLPFSLPFGALLVRLFFVGNEIICQQSTQGRTSNMFNQQIQQIIMFSGYPYGRSNEYSKLGISAREIFTNKASYIIRNTHFNHA